jgi:hypothetical protein
MIPSTKIRWIGILILLVTNNCGRKQRNIFSFHQEETSKKTVFDFPSPKEFKVSKTKDGTNLTWAPLSLKISESTVFLGYNVYRLNKEGFIPKKPLNSIPFKDTTFPIATKFGQQKTFFMIRGVYRVKNKTIEGLSSQIKTHAQ